MIRTQIAQAAIDLTQEFDKRNLGLTFKSNSLLETLYASTTLDFHAPAQAPSFEPTASDISLDTAFIPYGASRPPHDVALDNAIIEIADAARHHMDVARNKVRPIIQEFYERVEAAVKAMPTAATYNPEIVKLRLPEPMENAQFGTLVDEFRGTPSFEVELTVDLPAVDEAGLAALMTLNNTTLDADIGNWMARLGPTFFQDVYRQVFSDAARGAGLSQAIGNIVTGADAACAAFIMSKNLLDNPPSGLSMALGEYRSRLDGVIKASATKLLRSYDLFKAWEDTKTVLLSTTDACVRVCGSVFDAWTAEGGNTAVLLGAALSDRSMHTAAELAERATQYLDVWGQHNRTLTHTLTSRRYIDTITMLKFKTEQLLSDRATQCFDELVGTEAEINFAAPCVQQAKLNCERLIESYTNEDLGSLWRICVEIVAQGIFHYTDAYKLLMGIDKAMEDDPRLTIDLAAEQSMAEYLIDYVVDQMELFQLAGA